MTPPKKEALFVEYYGGLPDPGDVRIVQAVQSMYSTGMSSTEGWSSPLVRWWVGRMKFYMGQPGAWNEDDTEELYLLTRQLDRQTEAYGDLYDEEQD